MTRNVVFLATRLFLGVVDDDLGSRSSFFFLPQEAIQMSSHRKLCCMFVAGFLASVVCHVVRVKPRPRQ